MHNMRTLRREEEIKDKSCCKIWQCNVKKKKRREKEEDVEEKEEDVEEEEEEKE